MLKCTQGHDLAADAKFCGACGQPPTQEMVKCAACSAQFIKGANFCLQCGAAQGDATKDLDAALGTLGDFQKALTAKAATLGTLPELAQVAVDQKRVDEILKSAAVKDDKTGEQIGYDATSLVPELLRDNAELRRGNAELGAMVKSYVAHLAASDQKHAEAIGILMGTNLAFGHFLKAFVDRFEKWANSSRGRVAERTFAMVDRPATGGDQNAGDLRGTALMTKALAAKSTEGPLFTPHDIAVLETLQHHGVTEIKKARPELAARLEQIAA